MISLQPVVSHLHDLSIFVLDNPLFLFEGTMSVHQVTWNIQECGTLHFNELSCFKCEGECAHYFLSEKKYSAADNDASNPDDVEALRSFVLNCTSCHSDEYSSHFFCCHPRYWNKSGCMFLKFHCDIKQFHRNIKQFHCSIKEMENTRMEFHRSIRKAPFCPLCGVFCGTCPIHVLTCRYTTWSAEKNLFNDVPNFTIRKLNFQIIQRFAHKWHYCHRIGTICFFLYSLNVSYCFWQTVLLTYREQAAAHIYTMANICTLYSIWKWIGRIVIQVCQEQYGIFLSLSCERDGFLGPKKKQTTKNKKKPICTFLQRTSHFLL